MRPRFFISFLMAIAISMPSFAHVEEKCSVDTVIVIAPLPGPIPGGIPHSPTLVPISVSYESSLSVLTIMFHFNLGEVEIDVLNVTTGGYYSGIVDSQYLSSILPITMGPGHYIITFTLSSGQQYQGEFDVYNNLIC